MTDVLRRTGFLFIAVLFTLLLVLPATRSFAQQVPANNGTLKTHELGTPEKTINHDPKVCIFNFEGFQFDAQQSGYVVLNGQGQTSANYGPYDIFGPTDADGYASTSYFNDGEGPQIANGLYKATLYGKQIGGGINLEDEKAKSKNFTVNCDTVSDDEYYLEFTKKWKGDKVDLTDVEVVFTADDFTWTLGDKPAPVTPGETTLTNLKESVTGLPENCTYTSNLPSELTAPADTKKYGKDNTYTEKVTNTVECRKVKNTYYIQFDKVWAGDAIPTANLKVEFTGNIGEDDFYWAVGDEPAEVKPGKTEITNLEEKVTGMPANCTYTTDLQESVTAPKKNSGSYNDENVATVTVTNTVKCQGVLDDSTTTTTTTPSTPAPQVLATSTTTPASLPATGSSDVIAAAAFSLVAGLMAVTSLVAKKLFVKLS